MTGKSATLFICENLERQKTLTLKPVISLSLEMSDSVNQFAKALAFQ